MTSEIPDVFDHEPLAPPPTRGARVTGALMALLGGVAWVALLIVLTTIVPHFAVIFAEFDIKSGIPWLTRSIIVASHVATQGGIILLPMITIGTCLLVGFSVAGRRRAAITVSTFFGIVSLLLVMAAGTLIAVGLFLPLMQLTTAVSKSQQGGS
jgi:hypothetical protein